MTSVRAAKSKGSQFELDTTHSLRNKYEDLVRTGQEGFQLQYDLRSDNHRVIFECKRLKSMSWNQAKKYIDKLEFVSPITYQAYLLFKSNRQPCLVMYYDTDYNSAGKTTMLTVRTFKDVFGVEFEKHPPNKVGRKKLIEEVK